MNTNDNETVREVCAEMRKELNQSWWDVDREKIHDIPDRILSAYDCKMSDKNAVHKQLRENYHAKLAEKDAEIKQMHDCCDALEDELDAKNAEIARLKEKLCHDDGLMTAMSLEIVRLKAALKPVMKIKKQQVLGLLYKADCAEAVLEAQRIMKEFSN